jgi:cold shock CspA family protein
MSVTLRGPPLRAKIRSARVSLGIVAFWHSEEGWGAVATPARPGVGFVHFSNVRGEGFRELIPGSSVEFEWRDDFEQDGCQWRVAWVEAT